MQFIAEIRNVTARKTTSGDIEIVVKLCTDDVSALQLGTIPSDRTVTVEVKEN